MPYELHRSAIITGTLNCFCLACDRFLENREEALCHIKTSSHCESLSAVPYLEKFKDQYFRKFNAGYYCELCNKLMASAVQLKLHEAEDHHKQKKGTNLLKSMDGGVVAFNNIIIKERAWHGLMDKVCYICEIEFENEDLHKSDTSHALSLIQGTVKFGANDDIYRQINNSTVQCLTCNILLDSSSMNKHSDDGEHINLYKMCKIEEYKELKDEKDINEDFSQTTNLSNNTDSKDNKKQNSSCNKERGTSLITHREVTLQCSNIDINYETEVAFCRKCRVHIKFDYNDIVNHIEEHSNLKRSTSPVALYPANVSGTKYCTKPKQNEINVENINSAPKNNCVNQEINNERNSIEVRDFAKDNDITYNLNGGKAFCQTCKVEMPFSLKSMKEHVRGLPHNRNLKAKKAKVKNSQSKQVVTKYIRSLAVVKSPFANGYMINETVLISQSSFLLFQHKKGDTYIECLLCENIVSQDTLNTHVKTCSVPSGKKLQVILTDELEFIREIRPESFHCGHCNVIISGWSEMESHLQGRDHDRLKFNSRLCHGVLCGMLPLHALLLLEDE
ncbi:unnamed protein product [Arctia plantaginis]|nr:unnamed protein product [Arctia plantaginis]